MYSDHFQLPASATLRPTAPNLSIASSKETYRTALSQLAHVQHMYRRLDAHNDGLEDALRHLRSSLDAFRLNAAHRMRFALQEIRAELYDLRTGTAFILQSHAREMAQCREELMRRLCAAESSASASEDEEWRRAYRERHRRHLRTARAAHAQREQTLQRQIRALERLAAANGTEHGGILGNGSSGKGPVSDDWLSDPAQSLSIDDDVERRVRSRMLCGQTLVHPNPSTLRERHILSDTARRLIRVAGKPSESRELCGLSRGAERASDVATVARGAWAEEVLRQRSARRRRLVEL